MNIHYFIMFISVSYTLIAMELVEEVSGNYKSSRNMDPALYYAISKLKSTPPNEIVDLIMCKIRTEARDKLFDHLFDGYSVCKKGIPNGDCLRPIGNMIEEEARDHERQFIPAARLPKPSTVPTIHKKRTTDIDTYGWMPNQMIFFRDDQLLIPLLVTDTFRTEWLLHNSIVPSGQISIFDLVPEGFNDPVPFLRQIISDITPQQNLKEQDDHSGSIFYPSRIQSKHGADNTLRITTTEFNITTFTQNKKFTIYNLTDPIKSSSFEEALAHRIAYEVMRTNILIFKETWDAYDAKQIPYWLRIPTSCITKLASLSAQLSYNDTTFLNNLINTIDSNGHIPFLTEQAYNRLTKISQDTSMLFQMIGFKRQPDDEKKNVQASIGTNVLSTSGKSYVQHYCTIQ